MKIGDLKPVRKDRGKILKRLTGSPSPSITPPEDKPSLKLLIIVHADIQIIRTGQENRVRYLVKKVLT